MPGVSSEREGDQDKMRQLVRRERNPDLSQNRGIRETCPFVILTGFENLSGLKYQEG